MNNTSTPRTDEQRKTDMHTLENAFQFMEKLERELARALKLADDNGKLAHQTACELTEARKSAVFTHGRTTASAQGWALMYEDSINQRDKARAEAERLAAAIRRHRDAMQDTDETSVDDHVLWNSLTTTQP
jgi:hypothetical protein